VYVNGIVEVGVVHVLLAGHFSAIGDDLVNSYHLLLCCLDWIYANTLISNRRDLLNQNFSGFCIFIYYVFRCLWY